MQALLSKARWTHWLRQGWKWKLFTPSLGRFFCAMLQQQYRFFSKPGRGILISCMDTTACGYLADVRTGLPPSLLLSWETTCQGPQMAIWTSVKKAKWGSTPDPGFAVVRKPRLSKLWG